MRATTEWIPLSYRAIVSATRAEDSSTQSIASRLGLDFDNAIAFRSARSALVFAFIDAGLASDDEVLVPAYTCRALVEAVREVATPVFVDIEKDGFNMDINALDEAASSAEAVVPVHLFGEPMDMVAVRSIADEHDLVVVEDAAQGIGAMSGDTSVGVYGDYCVFSFRFSKEVTTYKGGLLLGDGITPVTPRGKVRGALVKLAIAKAAQGTLNRLPGPLYEKLRRGVLDPLFRLSSASIGNTDSVEFTAAQQQLLDKQLSSLSERVETRRRHADQYRRMLEDDVDLPLDHPDHTYFRFPVLVSPGQRASMCRRLRSAGIGVSTMYSYSVSPTGQCVRADKVARRILHLPVHAGLSLDDVDRISRQLTNLLGNDGIG